MNGVLRLPSGTWESRDNVQPAGYASDAARRDRQIQARFCSHRLATKLAHFEAVRPPQPRRQAEPLGCRRPLRTGLMLRRFRNIEDVQGMVQDRPARVA